MVEGGGKESLWVFYWEYVQHRLGVVGYHVIYTIMALQGNRKLQRILSGMFDCLMQLNIYVEWRGADVMLCSLDCPRKNDPKEDNEG